MKIIDLLVKIANRETVPKKIKYKNEIYERCQNITINNLYYYQVLNKCEFLIDQLSSVNDLLDEVEIIEEPKKIEKISWRKKESLAGNFTASEKQKILARRTEKLKSSLNELIDEINNLKEND